jgi:thiamine pyrophosphokinase
MSRFVIVTGKIAEGGRLSDIYAARDGDFVAAVDGGVRLARDCGIKPEVAIGDFDSMDIDEVADAGIDTIKLPSAKADTDTFAAAKHGVKLGYKNFLIAGGLSGRLDHTIANLQTLAYLSAAGYEAEAIDYKNRARMLAKGETIQVGNREKYFSVYSFAGEARVTIRNARWNLDAEKITNKFPVGTSNEPLSPGSEIQCEEGTVLVVMSID